MWLLIGFSSSHFGSAELQRELAGWFIDTAANWSQQQ
jgi:hypothetical protein